MSQSEGERDRKVVKYWKTDLELELWFDPAFEEFINKEIIPTVKVNK